jgi:hypothetical protein
MAHWRPAARDLFRGKESSCLRRSFAGARCSSHVAGASNSCKRSSRLTAPFPRNLILAPLGRKRYASKPQIFEVLKVFLVPSKQTTSYEEVAAKLSVSVPGVKTLIHRLRQQYTSLLRQEVARTLSDPAEVDQEIHYLCDVRVKAGGGL